MWIEKFNFFFFSMSTPRLAALYNGGLKKSPSKELTELRMKEQEKWEAYLRDTNRLTHTFGTKLTKSPATMSTGSILISPKSFYPSARTPKPLKTRSPATKKHRTIPTEELARDIRELNKAKRRVDNDPCYCAMEKIPFPICAEPPEMQIVKPVSTTINCLERFLL